ncbi:hypothetical protein [Levilactobacillus tujiorum]|nr:hypothetical protein [Levilactobacillus tujiorum]
MKDRHVVVAIFFGGNSGLTAFVLEYGRIQAGEVYLVGGYMVKWVS